MSTPQVQRHNGTPSDQALTPINQALRPHKQALRPHNQALSPLKLTHRTTNDYAPLHYETIAALR